MTMSCKSRLTRVHCAMQLAIAVSTTRASMLYRLIVGPVCSLLSCRSQVSSVPCLVRCAQLSTPLRTLYPVLSSVHTSQKCLRTPDDGMVCSRLSLNIVSCPYGASGWLHHDPAQSLDSCLHKKPRENTGRTRIIEAFDIECAVQNSVTDSQARF